jgi:hypothetical protein
MMGMESILPALAAFLLTAISAVLMHRRQIATVESSLSAQREATNAAQRDLHLKEMQFLRQRNEREVEFAVQLADEREKLASQRIELLARLEQEREKAAESARDKLRAEYELQNKLFSVKISPYVQLSTDKGFFKDAFEAKIGYQYQLLVNGIPAFQPHVVLERHEKVDKFDEAVKDRLLGVAEKIAQAAIQTYLGVNVQFAPLGPEVIHHIEQ